MTSDKRGKSSKLCKYPEQNKSNQKKIACNCGNSLTTNEELKLGNCEECIS